MNQKIHIKLGNTLLEWINCLEGEANS